MAWTSGTATDYRDLLARLRQFVTTDMTPAGERWTELRWETTANTQELILKGHGLSGADEIYVGIRSYENASAGWYWWDLQGLTGLIPSFGFYAQPGAITDYPAGMPLWNYAIPYWFFANGRRIIVVAKVGTSYETAYLGLMLPYATPQEHFYPMFVGGTQTAYSGRNRDVQHDGHRAFFNPWFYSDINSAAALIWTPSVWARVSNTSGNYYCKSFPYFMNDSRLFGQTLDGGYIVMPVQFYQPRDEESGRHFFGALDGVYYVSGMNNAAENVITVAGEDYLVIQNCHRTAWNEHAAIRRA